ncbi:TonB-dependent receptor [Rhodoferax sp.]|uniref:TonB-dependent receptor domain-containing protein n=1 Tax=Rhodoferax sp. TaxID=50421 RepID=UPI0026016F0E|nr:TonB-dependent receptor [Rhodoferax sp.]MDD2926199.1 TonB-dependent receptor [Rhodoferax sp.]
MKTSGSLVCRSASLRLVTFTSIALTAGPLLAQSPSGTTLQEVVVSANRMAVPVTDVIADVSIIDRSVLDTLAQGALRDVLALQPGVQFVSNGGYRSSTSVFLRGATSSQAIVLIDGIRVGSATSGAAAFENMPLERIERIEILRGAASALYGPDAVGGVIQIFTREPSDGLQLAANAGVGSDGQRQAGASIRGRAGAVGYSLGLSHEKATGISVTNNPAASSYNPDEDSFEVSSVDAKLTAQLSKQHALTLGLLQSRMDYQFDGTVTPNPLRLTKLTTDAWARPVLKHTSLRWDAQWLPQWKSSLTLGQSDDDYASEYFRLSDGAFNGRSNFSTHRTQATWQNDITLGADVLTLMLENRSEAVDSSTAYTVNQRDVRSAMVSYALNQPDWNVLAVLRNDNNSQFGDFNNWALSGGYKLTPHWRAVASLGTSFQAPSFNQLYYPGYGTPTLTPQLNRASEIGVKYQQGAVSAGAVLYYNEIQGFIEPSTNRQSSLAVLRGATLSLQAQRGNTQYALSYDYTDPHTQPNDLRFVRIAQNVLNLNVRQRFGAVQVFGELRFSSDREDNNMTFTGRDVLGGYGLLNLGAQWKVSPKVSLLARVNNVLDKSYMLANGYTMPGRNLLVSLSWAM